MAPFAYFALKDFQTWQGHLMKINKCAGDLSFAQDITVPGITENSVFELACGNRSPAI